MLYKEDSENNMDWDKCDTDTYTRLLGKVLLLGIK